MTWPAVHHFSAQVPPEPDGFSPHEALVKPDGCARVIGRAVDGGHFQEVYFLEVDRATEELDILLLKVMGYQDFCFSGGFAERSGGTRKEFKAYPFRVLVVMGSEARRNNLAAKILTSEKPALSMVCITTRREILATPLGAIWKRPTDYRAITAGTAFDPATYRVRGREVARDVLVEEQLVRVGL